MNGVQMHLALTHVPVILSLVGLGMLIIALLKKNPTLIKTSYIIIFISGIAALPVFFSGEGTEEAVEHAPGVSAAIIEKHEEVANLAMISIAAAGLVAFAALFSFRRQLISQILKVLVLLLAFTSGGLMTRTAHLGGQIRHTEIRRGASVQNGNKVAEESETPANKTQQQKQDDD
jgi:uncharacterized membrane protein